MNTTPPRLSFGLAIPPAICGFATDLTRCRPTQNVAAETWIEHLDVPGVESLWALDQLLGRAPTAESATLLSFVAALTSRPRLGIAVMVGASRGPVAAAKALSTLDWLSDGRLDVGFGLGAPRHYPAYGVDRVGGGGSGAILDEFLDLVERLWTQDEVDAEGNTWQLRGARLTPRPKQDPHPPMWIGGGSERSLHRAVDHRAGYIGAGRHSNAEFRTLSRRLTEILDERGRPPGFRISKRAYIVVSDDRADAEQLVREWFTRFYNKPELGAAVTVVGSVDECVEQLASLADAGADHLLLHPLDEQLDQYDVITQAVIPAVLSARAPA